MLDTKTESKSYYYLFFCLLAFSKEKEFKVHTRNKSPCSKHVQSQHGGLFTQRTKAMTEAVRVNKIARIKEIKGKGELQRQKVLHMWPWNFS